LPFFVLSATAPLLQRWFAGLGHPRGSDPYFLYVASNLGSMLALASYPLVIEPLIGLRAQTSLWRMGYLVLAALLVACAVATLRRRSTPAASLVETAGPVAAIGNRRRARWLVLAF